MSRKLPWILLLTACCLLQWQQRAEAATRLDAATIKAALQTVDKEEKGFVDRVVQKMDAGVLPRKIVHTAFLWARRKPEHKFQYFKKAVIVLAAHQGIRVS